MSFMDYSERIRRVVATCMALSQDGRRGDPDDLIDDLMDDYGWTEEEAELAIQEAIACGAAFEGPPIGGSLS